MLSKVLTTVVVACAVAMMNVSWAENRDVNDNCPNIDVSNYEKQCVKTEEILTLNDKELQIGKEYSFKKDAVKNAILSELSKDASFYLNLDFSYKFTKNNILNKTEQNYFERYSFYIKNDKLYLTFISRNGPLPYYEDDLFISNIKDPLIIKINNKEEQIVNFGYFATFKITKNKGDIKITLISIDNSYTNKSNIIPINVEIKKVKHKQNVFLNY